MTDVEETDDFAVKLSAGIAATRALIPVPAVTVNGKTNEEWSAEKGWALSGLCGWLEVLYDHRPTLLYYIMQDAAFLHLPLSSRDCWLSMLFHELENAPFDLHEDEEGRFVSC